MDLSTDTWGQKTVFAVLVCENVFQVHLGHGHRNLG
jgi:hypothetical protein